MIVQPMQYLPEQTSTGLQQGLEIGAGIARMRAAQEAAALERQKLEQARIAQENFTRSSAEFYANPNPTITDVLKFQSTMPTGMATALKDTLAQIPQQSRQAYITTMGQVLMAIDSDNPEMASQILQERAQANPAERASLERLWTTITNNPKEAFKLVAPVIAATEDGRKMLESREKARLLGYTESKESLAAKIADAKVKYAGQFAENELVKLANEARKTGLEADKLFEEVAAMRRNIAVGPELDADARKLVNGAVLDSVKTSSLASQYETLADAISKDLASGAFARAAEATKRFFGAEDQISRLRQEYRRLRNTQVIQNLPPGAASDIDMKVALEAFPPETADPDLIARFLRGTAKLQKYDAAMNAAQAEWAGQVGSLGRNRRDITIMGKTIPAGSNFAQVMRDLLPTVNVLDVPGIRPETPSTEPQTAPPAAPPTTPPTAPPGQRPSLENIFGR